MPGSVLKACCIHSHLMVTRTTEVATVSSSILLMRKLRLREVNLPAQEHEIRKHRQGRRHLDPGSVITTLLDWLGGGH